MPKPCQRCHGTGVEIDQVAFGAKMKDKRESALILLKDMASFMGITAAYLSDLEHGRRMWSKTHADAFTKGISQLKPMSSTRGGMDPKRFKEYRKDGWPLCPICGDDELSSALMGVWTREFNGTDKPTVEQCLEHGFACLNCMYVED